LRAWLVLLKQRIHPPQEAVGSDDAMGTPLQFSLASLAKTIGLLCIWLAFLSYARQSALARMFFTSASLGVPCMVVLDSIYCYLDQHYKWPRRFRSLFDWSFLFFCACWCLPSAVYAVFFEEERNALVRLVIAIAGHTAGCLSPFVSHALWRFYSDRFRN